MPREAPQDVSFATKAARQDLYGDAINEGLVVEPGRRLVGPGCSASTSTAPTGSSPVARSASARSAVSCGKVQNGFVRSYALSILGGVLIVVLALLAVNWS